MNVKDEHPCNNCQYFYGWQEVKVHISGMCKETMCVEIPICDKFLPILAFDKCKYFKKGEQNDM